MSVAQAMVFDRRACPGFVGNTLTLARRELREAVSSRWFLLYSIAFTALGLGVSYISAASGGGSGLSNFGRTTAGLVNLVLLVVPLMALSAGAGAVASDRERGMLGYLLAQPVSRAEVLLGKYLGLGAALSASICLGIGGCAAVLVWKGQAAEPRAILCFAGLSVMLALGMLSLGLLVSVMARKSSVAVGTAIFLWLGLVFVSDLGLMAGTLAFKPRIETLFGVCLFNPLQVFKMWTLHALDADLDVLGPAGLYASDEFGARLGLIFAGAMAAWVVAPMLAAFGVFSRRAAA